MSSQKGKTVSTSLSTTARNASKGPGGDSKWSPFEVKKNVPLPTERKTLPELGLERLREPGDMIEIPAELGLREGTVRSTVYKMGKELNVKFTVSKNKKTGNIGIWRM